MNEQQQPDSMAQSAPAMSTRQRKQHLRPDASAATADTDAIQVVWARDQDEVRQAQRLRFQVFSDEMGARLQTRVAGHDIDIFDDFCEHLLVRDRHTHQVLGA